MCRNIRTLHNFAPPATDEEIRAASLQFVRKVSGFTRPSKANQLAFSRAVDEVAQAARELLDSLVTSAPPRDRDVEASKARASAADRFRATVPASAERSSDRARSLSVTRPAGATMQTWGSGGPSRHQASREEGPG
jgi:hypothetical protein